MISRQMELGFENQPGLKPGGGSRGRSGRANWWFERMRGVVNHAREWPPVPPPAEATRPTAGRNGSVLPPSGTRPRASMAGPAITEADAPSTPEPHRWKFSRTRRLIWE